MSRKFGRTQCIIAGLNYAKGDCIVCIDSDLQDPPELIAEMVSKYEEGFEVVHTVRKKRLGEPWYKLFLTKIAYKSIRKDYSTKRTSTLFAWVIYLGGL